MSVIRRLQEETFLEEPALVPFWLFKESKGTGKPRELKSTREKIICPIG